METMTFPCPGDTSLVVWPRDPDSAPSFLLSNGLLPGLPTFPESLCISCYPVLCFRSLNRGWDSKESSIRRPHPCSWTQTRIQTSLRSEDYYLTSDSSSCDMGTTTAFALVFPVSIPKSPLLQLSSWKNNVWYCRSFCVQLQESPDMLSEMLSFTAGW